MLFTTLIYYIFIQFICISENKALNLIGVDINIIIIIIEGGNKVSLYCAAYNNSDKNGDSAFDESVLCVF